MGFRTVGLKNGKALVAALVAALLLPAAAQAVPVPATGDTDFTDCFDRTSNSGETVIEHDATDGNYWARRDTYSLNGFCVDGFFDGTIYGLSFIVKTPFQIDSTPDIDDIDSAGDFSILAGEMESLWPDFDHWGASAEVGGADPTIGPEGAFTSVEICINAASVAACISDAPFTLIDLGGGFMVHTVDLGAIEEEIYFCTGDCSEEITSFSISALFHSNVFDPPDMGDVDVPELVFGVQMIELAVPEPSVLALMGSALVGLALRRRSRS